MNLLYNIYKILTAVLFLILFPAFWIYTRISNRHGGNLKERLGLIPASIINKLSGSPRIWIHAASLGEVKVADAIIKSLKSSIPACSVIISTNTESGRNMAKQALTNSVPVIYAPIDLAYSVRKALNIIRPDILAFLETEIWPAWIMEAKQMGVKIALVNGRISANSIKGYLKLKPFFKGILRNIDAFSMIMNHDSSRIKALGASPDKITVNGNAKYDLLSELADPDIKTETAQHLNLDENSTVIVAGSTRSGEEALLIKVYEKIEKKFPGTIIIIAPRHIERVQNIGRLITQKGHRFQLRTEFHNNSSKRKENIIILNTFGELFNFYSIATLVFCGGSLVPLGGQNPLEPAAWGKPIFYGPHMDNFLDAKTLLEKNNASISVSGPDELATEMIGLLQDTKKMEEYESRAYQTVSQNSRMAEKHANVILNLIQPLNRNI